MERDHYESTRARKKERQKSKAVVLLAGHMRKKKEKD